MFYNDFIGAALNWMAEILGWTALLLIAGVGVWRSAMYVIHRAREVAVAAKREWREATEEHKESVKEVDSSAPRSVQV